MNFFLVGIFGLLGVMLRYLIYLFAEQNLTTNFPYSTFIINILGAFLIGVVYVVSANKPDFSPELRVGIMVGFLGGFTTFSAYCLETAKLFDQSKFFQASAYLVLSPLLGMLAVYAGMYLTRKIL